MKDSDSNESKIEIKQKTINPHRYKLNTLAVWWKKGLHTESSSYLRKMHTNSKGRQAWVLPWKKPGNHHLDDMIRMKIISNGINSRSVLVDEMQSIKKYEFLISPSIHEGRSG